MYFYMSSFSISLFSKIVICFLTSWILWIIFIIRPCKNDLARCHKSTYIIYMLIGLIIIDSSWKPQDFFSTKIFF